MDQSYDLSLLDIGSLRNKIGNVNLDLASNCCFAVISSLQSCPEKGAMVAGLSSAFVLLSELTGISVPDIIVMTKNMMTDGERRYPQFAAAQDFIAKEILNKH